ncbi:MAG: Ig-like domain-containing protein, partial [Anaerolineae bacterium]
GKLLLLTWGDAQPPAVPTNLVAVEGNGQVSLDWDSMPDAVTYNVYRSYVAGGGYELLGQDVADSQYVDTSVTNGTWYYYVVTAVDDVRNESDFSDEAAALPHASIGWAGNLEPTAITILIGQSTPPIMAQVWVDGVTNAPGPGAGILAEVGYGLATVPYENWDTWTPMSYVGEVGNNDQYQAILTPEDRGQFRYLARFSTTLGREWTYARTADGRIPILTVRQSGDVVPPRTPENLRVVDWGATFISLEWDPVIDDPTLYAYDVFRSTTSGVVGPWVGRVLAPDTTFTDTSVTSGLTYFYVVQAVDTSFNRSGYSNEVEATAEAKLVNVTFEVTVPDWTPGGATVYIVGDIGEFCGWCNPQTVALNQINDITWSRSFSLPDGLAVQYKYTRGNWDINEWWGPIVGVNNRHMTVDYGTTGTQFIADDVPYWRDPLVIAHEPLDGAVDVDTSVAISVTLSRYLDPATIVADNLVVTNGTTTPTLDITWFHHTNMTATTIIMTPQAPLDPGTLYDVTLGTGLAGLNSDNEGIHLQQP